MNLIKPEFLSVDTMQSSLKIDAWVASGGEYSQMSISNDIPLAVDAVDVFFLTMDHLLISED